MLLREGSEEWIIQCMAFMSVVCVRLSVRLCVAAKASPVTSSALGPTHPLHIPFPGQNHFVGRKSFGKNSFPLICNERCDEKCARSFDVFILPLFMLIFVFFSANFKIRYVLDRISNVT